MFIDRRKGFTLIEIIVSVTIFVSVALIVSGALVSLTRANRKAQDIRLLHQNLTFTLDSMSLKMRERMANTYFFACSPWPNTLDEFRNPGNFCDGEDMVAFMHDDKIREKAYAYFFRYDSTEEKIEGAITGPYSYPIDWNTALSPSFSDFSDKNNVSVKNLKFYSSNSNNFVRIIIKVEAKGGLIPLSIINGETGISVPRGL